MPPKKVPGKEPQIATRRSARIASLSAASVLSETSEAPVSDKPMKIPSIKLNLPPFTDYHSLKLVRVYKNLLICRYSLITAHLEAIASVSASASGPVSVLPGTQPSSATPDPVRPAMDTDWDRNFGLDYGTRTEWLAIDAGMKRGGADAEDARLEQLEFQSRRDSYVEDIELMLRAPLGLLRDMILAMNEKSGKNVVSVVSQAMLEEMRRREVAGGSEVLE